MLPARRKHVDEKAALRARVLARRDAVSAAELADASARACARLTEWSAWQAARTATAYAGRRGEIALDALYQQRTPTAPRVALPRILSANPPRLAFHFVDSPAQLVAERFGLVAPPAAAEECDAASVEIALVPGIAFCTDGRRLGQGGGYYDAWLPTATRALRVGVAHAFQLVAALPTDELDEPVDFLLTPDGLWATGARASNSPTTAFSLSPSPHHSQITGAGASEDPKEQS